MTSINERVQIIINDLYTGNTSEFERHSGIKPHTIKNIIGNRQTKPSYDILELILRNNVQISERWLITGEGEMLKTAKDDLDSFTSNGNTIKGDRNITGNKIHSGNINGDGNHIGIMPTDCEKNLMRAEIEIDYLKKENKTLKDQLKQTSIDKDKAMSMLDKALNK